MEIIWKPNPLMTEIILDDAEKKLLWHKIKIEELQGNASGLFFHLTHYKEEEKNEDWKKRLDSHMHYNSFEYIYDDGDGLSERVNTLHKYYLESLNGRHCGDCTCVPCSCEKCYAESLVEVDTIKGLGKHLAYKVEQAFLDGKDEKGYYKYHQDIDKALKYLKGYNPNCTGYESYFNIWKAEADSAYEWLLKYKEEHFP